MKTEDRHGNSCFHLVFTAHYHHYHLLFLHLLQGSKQRNETSVAQWRRESEKEFQTVAKEEGRNEGHFYHAHMFLHISNLLPAPHDHERIRREHQVPSAPHFGFYSGVDVCLHKLFHLRAAQQALPGGLRPAAVLLEDGERQQKHFLRRSFWDIEGHSSADCMR
ncbi:hypothetical protein CEXT_684171 [Caerostris extrusa]|uniref:Uncharacterized protein n=1 Tax=Caerostris extrusa TaxID=172846 RepID=A0AAV4T773_CAEEX|nr:hypothetical protein CEXT_684171 [Caerostris extrusa]